MLSGAGTGKGAGPTAPAPEKYPGSETLIIGVAEQVFFGRIRRQCF